MLVLLRRAPVAAGALAWMPIGYILATSCVEYRLSRYNAAVFPFMSMIAALPLAALAQWWNHRLAPGRPRARMGTAS